jgi:hypothetical protein
VCQRLLAVQAQDPRGARLAIRARTTDTTAADVDRALTEERSLLISWLNRGTLHLVRHEDYHWLHALTTPPLLTGGARRLAQEGVTANDAERAARVIVAALAGGPLTRAQLRERVDSLGVRTAGQAMVHLLVHVTLRGQIVRGPMVGRQHAFVLTRDWIGEAPPVARERALAELARRYLAGHGPATDRDLARWAGLPLRDARAGLRAIAGHLEEGAGGLVDIAGRAEPAPLPPPRLLGAFDPALLGWASREPVLRARDDGIVVSGGLFRPWAMVAGHAVATWSLVANRVALAPFAALSAREERALARDAADVQRFLALR